MFSVMCNLFDCLSPGTSASCLFWVFVSWGNVKGVEGSLGPLHNVLSLFRTQLDNGR